LLGVFAFRYGRILSTVCARELSARRFRFHLLRHLARRGTRTSGRCVGGIFRGRSFRGLFARYARHDIWRCPCRQPAERVQCIEFGSGFANRAAFDVVPRRVVFLLASFGISGWMRSRRLGIATASLALIGAVAVFAALRPFLHVVSIQ
jgi:hypothetical protein